MQKIKCKKCNAEIKNLGDNIEKVEIYDQYETGYIANDVVCPKCGHEDNYTFYENNDTGEITAVV
jgi:hypothetical protein